MLKQFKLMWEYLARNLKAGINISVLLNLKLAPSHNVLYRNLFNLNGMDFVTEISFCKTPVLDLKKMLILAIDRLKVR